MFASVPYADPFTTEATLAAWVYLDEVPSAAGHIFHICGKSGFGRDLDLQIETDNRFHFYVARGAPNVVVSQTVVQAKRWYRVAATYRRDDAIAIYVNGAREVKQGISGVERLPNVGPLSLGENFAFPGRKLHGLIDEVSFWNRALSPEEVAALERAPTGPQPGLTASYPLDGDALDHSANGLDGQLVGGALLISPEAPRTASPPTTAPAAPALPSGACPTRPIQLDQKSAFGPTPRDAMGALHAAEQRFVLSENHRGFFEGVGLAGPPTAHRELTLRFRADEVMASETPPCRPGETPTITITGTLTGDLGGGVVYGGPAGLTILGHDGRVEKGFANGWGQSPGHADANLLWTLSPQARQSGAILHERHGGDAFWRPADARDAGPQAADAAATRVGAAFVAMSGRTMRCSSRPVTSPGQWGPTQYRGAAPAVSIGAITLPSLDDPRRGSIVMQVAWPDDSHPTTFELALEPAAKTKTVRGYRMVGWSSQAGPLPRALTPTFACTAPDTARWWIVSEVFPDDQGTPVAAGSLVWGPGCDRYVSCSF